MKEKVLDFMNVCSCLGYPACKAYVFYAQFYPPVWPVWLYHIVPHYVIIGAIVIKRSLNMKSVFVSSTTFSETILTLRIIQPDIIINVHKSSCKMPHILVRF